MLRLLVIWLATLTLSMPTLAQTIDNPDFQHWKADKPTGWSLRANHQRVRQATGLEHSTKAIGLQVDLIEGVGDRQGEIMQYLDLEPATRYRVTGDMRATHSSMAFIQIKTRRAGSEQQRISSDRATEKWRSLSIEFDTADADRVELLCRYNQRQEHVGHSLWLTNMRIEKLGTGPANPDGDRAQRAQPIVIALAGDSTVCDYAASDPCHGWGQLLREYVAADQVVIANHAVGGRSSKSFINEGRWRKLLAGEPDFVLIQFGHNDRPGKGPDLETDPSPMPQHLPAEGLGSDSMDWYRHNLRTYIREARAIGATPVIVTPMERRYYADDGRTLRRGNKYYAEAAAAVAQETDTPLIDLNRYSVTILEQLGEDGSEFIQALRSGKIDNTHHSEAGARIFAEFVAQQLGESLSSLRPVIELPSRSTLDQAAPALR